MIRLHVFYGLETIVMGTWSVTEHPLWLIQSLLWFIEDVPLFVSAFCLLCVVGVCWLCRGIVVAVPRLGLVVPCKVSSGTWNKTTIGVALG